MMENYFLRENRKLSCLLITPIRRIFQHGEWYLSVVDVIEAVVGTPSPSNYWTKHRSRMAQTEGMGDLLERIEKIKLPGRDGREYMTDAANVETIFRIIQSIPSPKAEQFKRWLAKTGYERIQEFQNPEIAIKRAMMDYRIKGRDEEWIKNRVSAIMSRNEITSEWARRGIKKWIEYAILTNVISEETFMVKTGKHKELKNLPKSQELRDHMTDIELILTMLGETSTAELARARDAQGFQQNEGAAHSGGKIAGDARRNLEKELGRPVLSTSNFLPKKGDQGSLPG
jgi:hypothetical protein